MTEREIFLAALDLPVPADRLAYLDRACEGDPARRARIEALLSSHESAGSFLGRPAVGPPPAGDGATLGLDGPATPQGEGGADSLDFLRPSARPDSLGRLGHYEVLQVLGRGGFGIVFRAFDEVLQRVVAVKVLAASIASTSPARKRFLREARSSAKVRHENVVQVYAVEEQPQPYLVMEFIPGETLQQRIDRTGPLEAAEVVSLGRQIAEGLECAHGTGLIHRDIKPANILIEAGPHPRVKITDFGLARAADDASLTQSGLLAGTPMFMAPEQAHGEPLDPRADLFSLGSVLYTMCTGRPPFRANGTFAVLKRVAEDTARPIPEIIPEAPGWLCEIIAKLHAKRPEDRIATAREVADLLGRGPAGAQGPPALAGTGGANGAPAAEPAVRRPRPRARRWAVAAAILLMLFGGFGATEATGVTNVRGTVVRLFSPEGTLVVEVDDPAVSVKIDGSDIVITGAGAKEIRLTPGNYTVEASKDGKLVRQELVTVAKNGRQVVRVSQEPTPPEVKTARRSAWERSLAAMSRDERVKAVGARLKELNPGFNGRIEPTIENDVVTGLEFQTDDVADISPVRALTGLRSLNCSGSAPGKGLLMDLSPLRGLALTHLRCSDSPVYDLSPLKGMKLTELICQGANVSDLSPLAGMTTLTNLHCDRTKVSDLSPLKGMKLTIFTCAFTQVSDLSPLKDMRLARFNCSHSKVTDLSPLKEMKLTYMNCMETGVSDLSPLAGMKLTTLYCEGTPISDLSPLKDMNTLQDLYCSATRVTDLSPLKGCPLIYIRCDFDAARDAKTLRAIKTLRNFNDKSVTELRKGVEGQTAAAWERSAVAMSRDERVKAVIARLKQLNPGFDGKVTPTVEGGVVTKLEFLTDDVTDISPLRALTTLKSVTCVGSGAGKGRLKDLSPLRGLPLTTLNCTNSQVSDLAPLTDMKLEVLRLNCSQVSDLSPLKDMKTLEFLDCSYAKVSDLSPLKGLKLTTFHCFGSLAFDLSPLKGMPLETLGLWGWPGSDLTPLEGMPLKWLNCGNGGQKLDLTPLAGMPLETLYINFTQTSDLAPLKGMHLKTLAAGDTLVSDLAPLRGMDLKTLHINNTKVSDLAPLEGMPLTDINCDFKAERDAKILRPFKTLERINDKPAKEFWKEVEGKPKKE